MPEKRHPASDERRLRRAREIVDLAWRDLPQAHRALLEAIGAAQSDVVDAPLGQVIDDHLRSAGRDHLPAPARADLDRSLGAWIPQPQIVVIDAGHEKHSGLDDDTYEAVIARVAWHEWGHALSIARATGDDVATGRRLLALAPAGVAELIRGAGYREREYTHELIAEIYALLMARRRRGQADKPIWLDQQLYDLVRRVTGWTT